MLPKSLHELILAGGVTALEHAAATQAIEETRRSWLPIIEAEATRPDLSLYATIYLAGEIRRLRRMLKLPPPPPSAADQQLRREQTRDRVRRHRARLRAGAPPS
jgi:hypothetical protein